MDKNFKTLELDIILEKLANECTCDDSTESEALYRFK